MTDDTAEVRIVLTGGRSFDNFEGDATLIVDEFIRRPEDWPLDVEIIHGGAIGFDQIMDRLLREKGWWPIVRKPDYERHGGATAPLIRNEAMVEWGARANRSILLAMWNGRKKSGTHHTFRLALERGYEVHVWRYRDPSTD